MEKKNQRIILFKMWHGRRSVKNARAFSKLFNQTSPTISTPSFLPSGGSRGGTRGGPPPPLILDQTEAQGAEKKNWRPAPLPNNLGVWMTGTPVLSQSMDPALLPTRNIPTNPKTFPSITTILRLVTFLWEALSPPCLWQTGRLLRWSAAIAQIRCDSSKHAAWTSVRMIVRDRCFKIFDNCEITMILKRTRVTTR